MVARKIFPQKSKMESFVIIVQLSISVICRGSGYATKSGTIFFQAASHCLKNAKKISSLLLLPLKTSQNLRFSITHGNIREPKVF